jgi:ribose transport system ATP-binding protein
MSDQSISDQKVGVAPGEEIDHSPRLRLDGISKSFRHVQALQDVSIEVETGEVVGLVGENGAGKSTLLKILTGEMDQDEGTILIGGEAIQLTGPRQAASLGISIVHQEQEVITSLAGYENFFLGREKSKLGILNRSDMLEEAEETINELGIDLDLNKAVRDYSFTDRQMLEIAKSFGLSSRVDNPVILLDEPTAALEGTERDILFSLISDLRSRASFVFVSHELEEVLEICDRIYVLKDGELVEEVTSEEATYGSLQQSMVGRELSPASDRSSNELSNYYKISDQIEPQGEAVLEVDDLTYKEEVGPVSFSIDRGEIFGIIGVDGCGKERLGRLLIGDLSPTDGSISIEGEPLKPGSVAAAVDSGLGYIPKERKSEGLLLYLSVSHNTSLAIVKDMFGNLPFLDKSKEETVANNMVQQLDIKTPSTDTLTNDLSGGNQQKVVIGRWLARDTPILIVDNITRGIDVGAKEQIYQLCRDLVQDGVSIVFIGDELAEVIAMSNRIGVMRKGEIKNIYKSPKDDKPEEEKLIKDMV